MDSKRDERTSRTAGAVGSASVALTFAVAALAGCYDPPPLAEGLEGCLSTGCHARVEHIHYGGAPLACTDCHGGDPTATTKEAAHPTTTISFNAATPGVQQPGGVLLANASLQQLDELDKDVLQFLNPADYRIVDRTCGSTTRGGGNCHTRIAQASVMSNHATLAGQLAGGLYFSGLTDRKARYGVRAVSDPFPLAADGYIGQLDRLPDDVSKMTDGGATERGHFASMGQLCVDCHLSRDGVMLPGKYTSAGCDGCHLLTANDTRTRTTDVTQDIDEMGHPERHRLTNLIPDSQCNHCHHAHLHRGLLAQGVRERSEPDGDTGMGGSNTGVEDPPNAVYWPESNYVRYQGGYSLYGKPYPFYIEDEDGTNDVDETPPDIHTEKGMGCIDCHTMAELHGPEHMTERLEFETRVRCQSCHGSPDKKITPGDLPFVIAKSRVGGNAPNKQAISRDADGYFSQLGKFDNKQHPLTQIANRADPSHEKFNPRTQMGCALHSGSAEIRAQIAARFASTDPAQISTEFPGMPNNSSLAGDLGSRRGRLECFSCHNKWTVNCYGCHVERDDRVMATNRVTGAVEPGKISNYAMSVIADGLALGFNTRGRISPMVGTAIFFTHIDANGNKLVDAQPLTTVDGFSGNGNEHNPVHHHTVRRIPRDCQSCHPRADGIPDNETFLKRVMGFGTGEFVFVDGQGTTHLLDKLVNEDVDGDGMWEDPVTTPLGPVMSVAPAAASTHFALTPEAGMLGPGPLDAETINRMINNRVVPQRAETAVCVPPP